ncbi:hypothetical protein OKW30_006084 [Paraburkholderia sp. Clong3]|uniref:hypothetical protein n=1 Tax=Paraburkholderia sp. Clong3 TaxID=2991061 RepID=UPI003D1B126C
MDALNNAEESSAAKREQSKALKQAGINHPRQRRRQKPSTTLNISEMVKKMGKQKSASSRQEPQRDDIPKIDGKQHPESGGNGSIAERMSKNMGDILDSI